MEDTDCTGCYYAVPMVGADMEPNVKCRRFPPIVYYNGEQTCQASPDAHRRCGEFKDGRLLESLAETLKQVFPKEDDG